MSGRSVLAYAPDLMDRSRLTAAVAGLRVAPTPAALVELAGAELERGDGVVVLVDLSRRGVLDAVRVLAGRGVRVVGFAPHVDDALLAAGRDAGAEVLARSRLFARVRAGEW